MFAFSTTGVVMAAPYAVDSSTLQLWHFDGNLTNAVPGGYGGLTAQLTGTPATLNNAAYDGSYGTSASNFGGGNYLGAGAPNNAGGPGQTDSARLALQNGTTRAFTYEALVKLSTLSGAAGAEIISGEGEGAVGVDRVFQFKLDPIGFAGPTGSDATKVRIEFNNISGSGTDNFVTLSDTGTNAPNTSDWFHVAVTYSGTPSAAGNIAFYWTKIDPNNTVAALAGTGTQAANIAINNNGATGDLTDSDFAIGNELRSTGGQSEGFIGSIDEVRISSIARAATDFIVVPEPASLALLGIGGLSLARRRRV